MILELLKRVCKALDENKFPYMISGSIAMNIYSVPRMTMDIDIVVELSLEMKSSGREYLRLLTMKLVLN
jgi:hypothetical protein